MVETVADLTEIQMKVFVRHAAVGVEPVLGIAPETLDAVDMVPPLGTALLLTHDDVIALHPQTGVGLPVVSVVEAARGGVGAHQGDDFFGIARGDREGLDLAVSLHDAHDQHLAGSTPAALAFAEPAEQGFVTLDRAGEGLAQLLGVGAAGAQDAVEALARGRASVLAEPLPVDRHPQGEHLNKTGPDRGRQLARLPHRAHAVAPAAAAAIATAIRELVARTMIAFRTAFHLQTSVNLVRLG